MNTNLRFLNYLLVAGFCVSLAACGGGSKNESAANDVEFSDTENRLVTDMTKVISNLPSPTEVPYMLEATAADFDKDLINNLDRLSQYATNEDESALNLGVYATDMGYLLSYDRISDSQDYLEACQKLSEAIGVSSVFNVKTMENFQNNMNDPEAVNELLAQAIVDAEMRLESADRSAVAALVLTGSFIEGLYLAVKVIETYPTDVLDESTRNLILEPMVRVVLDQRESLMDVIAMLKDLEQDDIIAKMRNELSILRILYDGDLAEIKEKIANNQGDFMITQEMLRDITSEVKRVRSDIVDFNE